MSEPIEGLLSEEDQRLVELNELGSILAIHRLQPSYIHFLYWSGLLLIAISGAILAIAAAVRFIYSLGLMYLLPALLGAASGLLGGVACIRIVIPQEKQEHIIVCEQGMLHIIGDRYVEIIRWAEVQSIDKKFLDRIISITYTTPRLPYIKVVSISCFYQDFDHLIGLIKQQSKAV